MAILPKMVIKYGTSRDRTNHGLKMILIVCYGDFLYATNRAECDCVQMRVVLLLGPFLPLGLVHRHSRCGPSGEYAFPDGNRFDTMQNVIMSSLL